MARCPENDSHADSFLHAQTIPEPSPGGPNVGDLQLAFACAQHDAAAIATLMREHFTALEQRIRPIAADGTDEVLDAVKDRVLVPPSGRHGKIREYSGKSSLARWLQVIAVREALRWQRKRRAEQFNNGAA